MSFSVVVKSDLGGDPCTTTENVAYAATVKFATHNPVYEDIPRSDNRLYDSWTVKLGDYLCLQSNLRIRDTLGTGIVSFKMEVVRLKMNYIWDLKV